MRYTAGIPGKGRTGFLPALLSVAFLALLQSPALGFTLNVVGQDGNPIPVAYQWLVEEDTTHYVTPGVPDNNSVSTSIHSSHAPVVAYGTSADLSPLNDNAVINPAKRYFISVLPEAGYSHGGAAVAAGQTSVKVLVTPQPVSTAQITVFVFNDNQSLNNAPDIPAEEGLPGFRILLSDQGGQQAKDAYGNELGTVYATDSNGNVLVNPDGSPQAILIPGEGIFTNADGHAVMADNTNGIRYLAPGKYGVRVISTDNLAWIQTATIEGTPGVDAWVRANEPPYFAEAGFFAVHMFFGFVHPTFLDAANTQAVSYGPQFRALNPGETAGTLTGQVMSVHTSRPPLQPGLEIGRPAEEAWVGLNDLNAADQLVYASPCFDNGSFVINNVPPGTYQLVMWDKPLDMIIDFRTVLIDNGAVVDLGQIPIFRWFGFFEGNVFYDANRNGFRDPGETGIPNQAVNLRFRDGTIYQSFPTDVTGKYRFREVFPFFKWLVAEVDFATLEATGATIWVDNGGKLPIRRTPPVPVDPADPNNRYNDILNPQPQPDNGGANYRTETGIILLQGMLLYADQTNVIDWGKSDYLPGQNGGISGIVFYDSVRAENDPTLNGGEPWQPGIPRVAVNLYADGDRNGVIDDVNGDGKVTLADVDNFPFDNFPGPEDIDRNGNARWDAGDAIHSVHTDSWDDSLPTGCVNQDNTATPIAPYIDCAEMMRTWNQVRPAVFDGGYAFVSYFPGGIDSGSDEVQGLPAGAYIVEMVPPYGYEVVKEEDKNVDFGDPFTPGNQVGVAPLALTDLPSTLPLCVGTPHVVRPYLSDGMTPNASFDPMRPGKATPLCDRKQVIVEDGKNAAADLFLFTAVPKAARMVGLVTNDLLLEFNPNSPRKGDKVGPSWMPISVRDWMGNEVVRVYSDEWGQYNSLVPSTVTSNVPAPSGVSPNMLTMHLNHPGPIESPPGSGNFVSDSFYNPAYAQIATSFDFWPGKTTYVDTPVLPIAAFAGRGILDCEVPDGTPVISQVDGPAGGPWVSQDNTLITITSLQGVSIAGVPRDFGFGDNGVVTLGGVSLDNVIWTPVAITGRVPVGASTGQISVTRRDTGRSTVMGITLHVGGGPPTRVVNGQSIQAAVDAALPGDLILVGPGIYKENVILWKPVRLQGNGAWSTAIDAFAETLALQDTWLAKLDSIIGTDPVGQLDWLVPGERADFFLERGAGITVLANRNPGHPSFHTAAAPARIDGFLITRSVQGGGIFVNANAHHLRISNNKLQSNQGTQGGGIRVGTPSIVATDAVGDPLPGATGYNSSFNDNLVLHNNHIDQNGAVGGLGGSGGGISLFNGSDDYTIRDSWICGNFALVYGGGIAHFGLSPRGVIENNAILFNESFDEGGGIIIAGELVPGDAPAGTLTPGAGSVTVNRNLIQGNHGGDDGGGIRTLLFSGQDVANNPLDNTAWHRLNIVNNMIVNNVSADTGGGIALDDTASVNILHNTIAHNDSTATGSDAFGGPCDPLAPFCEGVPGGGLTSSLPQAAGLASRAHSVDLQTASGQLFSDPVLYNNIIWQNRSFFWNASANGGNGGLTPADNNAAGADAFWNLQVYAAGPGAQLKPRFCLLDNSVLGNQTVDLGATNVIPAPGDNVVSSPYFNVYEATSGGAALGNFVTVVWTPTVLTGDYHIQASSRAVDRAAAVGTLPVDAATQGLLGVDFDLQGRPFDVLSVPNNPSAGDIGADEFQP